MQRVLLMVILTLFVSLFVVAPAQATEEECPHTVATIEALKECVQHAQHHGHIDNAGVARSLLAKLRAAQNALDHGATSTAIKKLEAFIHQVQAQSGKHIAAEHATELIGHADLVLQALGS